MSQHSIEPRTAIGLIGLGRMGFALAERLLDLGEHLIVWNRSGDKAEPLVERGASLAKTPADVVHRCPTSLVIVRDEWAMRDVYFGPGGLLSTPLNGCTVVDMTTARAPAVREMGEAVCLAGGRFIDAPVSGTVGPTRSGSLVVLAGGEPADIERVRPVLQKLARKLVHAGPMGSGIVMKLVLNLPLASYWQALGEALALGRAHGLEIETMLQHIADSKAAIGALPSKMSAILGVSSAVEFDVAGLHKDLRAMCDTAESVGLDLPVVSAAALGAGDAVAAGWGDRDLAQLVRFVAD